jgi:hypothetical protein
MREGGEGKIEGEGKVEGEGGGGHHRGRSLREQRSFRWSVR